MTSGRLRDLLAPGGVFAVSLLLSVPAILHLGRLGFHFEDLSIPFDGGYRILLGERPFADFSAPVGPVLFLQQAFFFRLFGVGLDAYLVHAAVLNALAASAVWLLLRRFDRTAAVAGAAVTVCWFYLVPAAPYIDTTAFFWTLLAVVAGAGAVGERSATGWWGAVAGVCAGTAFLVKQNVGGLAVAGVALLLLLDALRDRAGGWRARGWTPVRRLLPFVAGAAFPLLLLAFYAVITGGWGSFVHDFFAVPLGSGRLRYLIPWGARMAIKVVRPELVNSGFAEMAGPAVRELLVYAGVAALGVGWLRATERERRFLLATAAFLLLLQQWSFNTSNNNEVLYWPFAGLLLGLLAVLARRSGLPRRLADAGVAAAAVVVALLGLHFGAERTAHDLRVGGLSYEMSHPRLAGLRMPEPAGPRLDALLAFLEREVPAGEPIAVIGETTVIHGAVGRPPGQPLLWFRAGVSYPAGDATATEERILRALDERRVGWVVVDDYGAAHLDDPLTTLAAGLAERYGAVGAGVTGFRVLRRRSAAPAPRG
jgi:hypothetical protein